jgi:hypothetical protein
MVIVTIKRGWNAFSGLFRTRWGGVMFAALAIPALALGVHHGKSNDILFGICNSLIAVLYFIHPPRRNVCPLTTLNHGSSSTTNGESNRNS